MDRGDSIGFRRRRTICPSQRQAPEAVGAHFKAPKLATLHVLPSSAINAGR
jgi:hypothetical protein